MVLAVGRWPSHLSALHRFDEHMDKIAAYFRSLVMEVETRRPGLSGRLVPIHHLQKVTLDGRSTDRLACCWALRRGIPGVFFTGLDTMGVDPRHIATMNADKKFMRLMK
jgi:hypothetical protein